MNLIVAVDKNWGIGRENALLYHLPEDLRFFKAKTTGKVIVCGKNTLLSFPGSKPLPNRTNLVLTSGSLPTAENLVTVHSLGELSEKLKEFPDEDIFVCGGESVYRQLYRKCRFAYVTRIDCDSVPATVFFPDLSLEPQFSLIEESEKLTSAGGLAYRFQTFENKSPE